MSLGKIALVAVTSIAMAAPASAATYYVAQSAKTKHCLVTTKKPNGTSMSQVGSSTYATKKDASDAMKSASKCSS